MPWRQVLVALICTGLTVRSSPCSWVEVLSSWSQGYKAVVKLQMEETVDHWDVDVEFSKSVINFEAWKGHVNKISDTFYSVSNTCYNNMVYSCQCFELPYIVRHEPMWEGNTTFKFNGDVVPACDPPFCDDSSSSGEANTTSTTSLSDNQATTETEINSNLNVVNNILNDLTSLGRIRYKRQSNDFTKDENELLDTLAEYTTYLKNECSTISGNCQSKTLATYGSKLNAIIQKIKKSGGISSGFLDAFKEKRDEVIEASETADRTQSEKKEKICMANGRPCIFPFKDDAGKEHNTCADYKGRYFWCATGVNSKGTYISWEKCPKGGRCDVPNEEKATTKKTTTTTTTTTTTKTKQGVSCMAGSKPCVFPFKNDDGTEHNECADYKGRYLWCATAVNSKGTYTTWGKCTECKDPNTSPSTPGDCSCTDYINKKGYGDCKKGHPDFNNAEICYVKLPSTCSDLRESKTDPGKMASAEACKKDCSCTDYLNKKGYGQCKKGHPDFNNAEICYVKLPSACSDLKESKTDPGKMASAEACKKDDSCCQELDIASTGIALEHQGARLGSYKKQAEENDGKPVYLQEGAGGNYLFYRETFGWLISRQGPQSTSKGGIMSDSSADCPTDGGMQWKIYDRVTYDNIDSTFKLTCKGSDTTLANPPTKPTGSCLANGKQCIFPFKDDDGTSYNGCPKYEGRYYWCATSLKTNGVYEVWEHCPEDGSCPLLNDDDSSTSAALPKPTTKPSESSETTPSAMWEPGTTSFYISDGNNNYKCEISFEFNANKKTEFRAISSTCSESNNQEDVMQYVGKHNFSLQSKEGATLECFVGVSIARGDLCQTVLEDSLNCDAKSETACGKTRAGRPDKRWDLQECPDGYQTSIDAEPLYTLMDWTKEGGEYTKQDCVDACKGDCRALIYTYPCEQCKLLTEKEYAKDETEPESKYCLKSVGPTNEETCCDTLSILSSGETAEYQYESLGIYKIDGDHNNKPVYKQQGGTNKLFFSELDSFEWVVGSNFYSRGGLRSKTGGKKSCPSDAKQWEYYVPGNVNTWIVDLKVVVYCKGADNVETPCYQSDTKSKRDLGPCRTHNDCKTDPARPYCQHPTIPISLGSFCGKSYCRTAQSKLCNLMEYFSPCKDRWQNTFCDNFLGECIECDNSHPCQVRQKPVCHPRTHKCVECTTDKHCQNNKNGKDFCDTATNTCVVECVTDIDCQKNGNANANGPLKCNLNTNTCVMCIKKTDCKHQRVCDSNTNTCVTECTTNTDCQNNPTANHNGRLICNSITNTCVDECVTDTDCQNAFSKGLRHCNSNTNKCVSCLRNQDCKTGNDRACSSNNDCVHCLYDKDCRANNHFHINHLDTCASNTCVRCVTNAQCTTPPNRICNNNNCVECLTDIDCPGYPANGCNINHRCAQRIQCIGFGYLGWNAAALAYNPASLGYSRPGLTAPELKILNHLKVEIVSFHLDQVLQAPAGPRQPLFDPLSANCPYRESGRGGTRIWANIQRWEQIELQDIIYACEDQAQNRDGFTWDLQQGANFFFKLPSNARPARPPRPAIPPFSPTTATSIFAPTATLPSCFARAGGIPSYP